MKQNFMPPVANIQKSRADIYEKGLSDKIIACAFEVYNNLGHGFLEKFMKELF